jgi:hypothetical protein
MLCIGLNFMLSHAPENFQSLQRKFSVHFFPGKAGSRYFKTRIVLLFLSLLFMMIRTGTQTGFFLGPCLLIRGTRCLFYCVLWYDLKKNVLHMHKKHLFRPFCVESGKYSIFVFFVKKYCIYFFRAFARGRRLYIKRGPRCLQLASNPHPPPFSHLYSRWAPLLYLSPSLFSICVADKALISSWRETI